MAETTIRPYNLSIAKNIIGALAQTNHFLVTFSSLTPAVESYLANYTGIRNIKSFLREVYEYAKNQAKWRAATEFCEDRLWEFKVMTEVELGIK